MHYVENALSIFAKICRPQNVAVPKYAPAKPIKTRKREV